MNLLFSTIELYNLNLKWYNLFSEKEDLMMLASESEKMLEATEKLLELSGDEQARWYALSRELSEFKQRVYEHDMKKEAQAKGHAEGHAKGHIEGYAEGHAQGIEYGEHKKAIEIAKKLLELGTPTEVVIKASGLTFEEIEELNI